MSEVRTFRAASMHDALELVRHEMGGEAVILHTRQIPRRGLLPWKKSGAEVEITAGLGVNVRPPASRARQKPKQAAAVSAASPPAKKSSRNKSPEHAATKLQSGTGARNQSVPVRDDSTDLQDNDTALRQSEFGNARVSTARLNRAEAIPAASMRGWGPAGLPEGEVATQFAAKLDAIQQMLESLGHENHALRSQEIPGELFQVYTELIDADVEEELARDLVFRLKQHATPQQLGDWPATKTLLAGMVESEIRCSDPIAPTPGKRKVVALVGSTGVGKTTTIAKLAANFRLRDSVKMGLVTVDTYRIAAVEQLRTYAEIIDLPMRVVTSPPEMRRALDELLGLDLILIDTAGRSPRDELQIQELKSLLSVADVDEVHLVMSMTASLKTLEATAAKFAAANATSLIMTKLDEAAGMGTLLSIARKVSLPLSYLTTGQDVPDDIEPATSSRVSRLVLGQDRLMV